MKFNLTGFVATTVAWALLCIAVSAFLLPFHIEMVWSGLILGAIVAGPATLISQLFGGVRNHFAYVLTAGIVSGCLFYAMGAFWFNDAWWGTALVAVLYGVLAGDIGATVARKLHD